MFEGEKDGEFSLSSAAESFESKKLRGLSELVKLYVLRTSLFVLGVRYLDANADTYKRRHFVRTVTFNLNLLYTLIDSNATGQV